jgi:nicotinamidase/pyrazinamidase
MNENYGLIIVDVQFDFLPGGELAVPDGDSVLHPISLLAREASLVVASRDWHPEDHFSFSEYPQYVDQSWPPHCIQGTKGARVHPSMRKLANFTVSKGTDKNVEDYSAFRGRTLRPVQTLQEILDRSPLDALVVTGLALDYCVRYTALDANALGYKTIVPLNATRAVSPEGEKQTLEAFKKAGVIVVPEYQA